MGTLTRKQREIQERERLILETARSMLVTDGYHGLSMDRIAESLEYSKGTIYNHFRCKEEIIIALVIATLDERTLLFARAAKSDFLPRERMVAAGVAAELFMRLFPDHANVEQIVRTSSIREKTSEIRQAKMLECETRCLGILTGIVRDGIERRELEMPEGSTPEELVFGLWSLTFGAYSIIDGNPSLPELGIDSGFETVRQIQTRLLDGYGWHPLSHERDYVAVEERIREEVFSNEFNAALAE